MLEWMMLVFRAVSVLCFTFLCHMLLVPRFAASVRLWRYKLSVSGLAMLLLYILYYIGQDALHFNSILTQNLVRTVWLLACTATLYKRNFGMKLYLVFTFTAISMMSQFISFSITNIGSSALLGLLVRYGGGTGRWDNLAAVYSYTTGFSYLLISAITLFCAYKIYKKYPREKTIPNIRETLFLLVPSLACVVIGAILQLITTYSAENDLYFYTQIPAMGYIIPLAAIVMLGGIFITLELFRYQVLYYRQKRDEAIMQNRYQDMQQRIKEIEGLYSGIRGLKHDMKNHLAHLAGLIKQAGAGNEEISAYFSSMHATLQELDYAYSTGHPVTDVVVNGYAQRLKEHGFSFTAEFQYPTELNIDAFDISIILANALDNAMEAAANTPNHTVRLRGIAKSGRFFLIEVENSFSGFVQFAADTGLPRTTKAGAGHGIGLQNIRECARKYMGDIDIHTDGHIFTLAVMMNGRQG